jgi:protein arginine kinase activator
MKCDFCDQKASVFLTQLVDGQMKKVNLCGSCAKAQGVTDPTAFSLTDLLFGNSESPSAKPEVDPMNPAFLNPFPLVKSLQCATCGFSLEDLRRVRRLGCSECYTTFAGDLSQMLRGVHKGMSHAGKFPAGFMTSHLWRQRLQELQEGLDRAVSAENYEQAARIRDEIKLIENQSQAPTLK